MCWKVNDNSYFVELKMCIRSHDLRVASDCKRDLLTQQHVPGAAEQAIEKIAQSVHRT